MSRWKKITALSLCMMFFLSGCIASYKEQNKVPSDSYWQTSDGKLQLFFSRPDNKGLEATGTWQREDKTWEIEVAFGPEETAFTIYEIGEQRGDKRLWYGDFKWDEEEGTIKLTPKDDPVTQISKEDAEEMVLYQYEPEESQTESGEDSQT